jgi:hypothetical protein
MPVESVTLMTPEGEDMGAPMLDTNPLGRPGMGVADMPRSSRYHAPRGPEGLPETAPPVMMAPPATEPPPVVAQPAPMPAPQPARPPAAFMKAGGVAPAAPGVPVPPIQQYPEAVGFGRDIPLALAMQQIVPPGYAYAFDNGVNPGMRVNWNGGKPWNQVLQDAVTMLGLNSVVTGNTVWVGHGKPGAQAPAPAAGTYGAASLPAATAEAQPFAPPVIPASAPAPGFGDGDRPVNDWQAEQDSYQSYPRRDVEAARQRLMEKQMAVAAQQEPAGFSPDADNVAVLPANTVATDAPLIQAVPAAAQDAAAPIPLMVDQQPSTARNYTQLTGLNGALRQLDPQEIRYWQARPGENLKDVLRNWSEQAGVELFWAEGMDYTLPQAVQMHGTFQEAVTRVLQTYDGRPMQPKGQLHPNLPAGPAVLIIDHMS